MRLLLLAVVLLPFSCGAPPEVSDGGGLDAGTPADAGAVDAGPPDAGLLADAGLPDAGVPDAGLPDAGPGDAGETDAGVMDGGADDAGADDAGTPDGGASDAGTPDAGPPDAGAPDAGRALPDGGVVVRVIAANLTSGNLQTWDLGEGQRILQALQGDIVAIQEFNAGGNTDAGLQAFVDATFDAGFFFVRGGGRIPNGVISRFPIVDAGEWNDTRTTDREFTWALVDAPGPVDLWVVSLHLLSSSAANRNAQAVELLQYVNANVPAGTHLVLAGDLNTDSRGEACLGTLDASVVVRGPWPSDLSLPDGGNSATSGNRSRPYDWVLVSPDLHAREVPVMLGPLSFPNGLVFDTRVINPLPEPAFFTDSEALNMQHMAVVRDFVLGP